MNDCKDYSRKDPEHNLESNDSISSLSSEYTHACAAEQYITVEDNEGEL